MSNALTRQDRKARSTGARIIVEDTHHPESSFDSAGGRWATLCMTHGAIVNHDTLALARSHAAAPEGWCEECADSLDN